MWDIRDIIYGFFMSGDSSFSLSSAIALCATEQPFMSSGSLGEAILGSDEQPGILENMWEALIKGVRASGSSFQSATQTAGAAMQSSVSSITNTMNRMANLRLGLQTQMA